MATEGRTRDDRGGNLRWWHGFVEHNSHLICQRAWAVARNNEECMSHNEHAHATPGWCSPGRTHTRPHAREPGAVCERHGPNLDSSSGVKKSWSGRRLSEARALMSQSCTTPHIASAAHAARDRHRAGSWSSTQRAVSWSSSASTDSSEFRRCRGSS
jgi:hypothetical protein